MKTLTHEELKSLCSQVEDLLASHGLAVLRHADSDVEHHVTESDGGWLVTTLSGLGVLHQFEYRRIESLGLDLAGADVVVPRTRARHASA